MHQGHVLLWQAGSEALDRVVLLRLETGAILLGEIRIGSSLRASCAGFRTNRTVGRQIGPEISQNDGAVPVSGRIEMDQRQDHPPAAETSLHNPRLAAQARRVQKDPVALLQIGPADDPSVRHGDIRAEGVRLRLFIPGQYVDIRIRDPELRGPPGGKDGRFNVLPDRMLGRGKADAAAEAGDPFREGFRRIGRRPRPFSVAIPAPPQIPR